MARQNVSTTRIGILGGLAAAAAIISLSGLTGPAASAGPVLEPAVERAGVAAAPVTTDVPVPTTAVEPVATTAAPPPSTTTPPTTAAPTTTAAPATTAPPPPTTAAPAPAPEPVAAPAAQQASAPQERPEDRIRRLFASAVPQAWQDDIAVELEIIEGSTSWAHGDGRILVARSHAEASDEHLADVLAHEFGHLIAFAHGTRAYVGAAPEGWPEPAENPAEAWADCVQTAFTGRTNPSHGLRGCGGAQLDWAAAWLAQGPPTTD